MKRWLAGMFLVIGLGVPTLLLVETRPTASAPVQPALPARQSIIFYNTWPGGTYTVPSTTTETTTTTASSTSETTSDVPSSTTSTPPTTASVQPAPDSSTADRDIAEAILLRLVIVAALLACTAWLIRCLYKRRHIVTDEQPTVALATTNWPKAELYDTLSGDPRKIGPYKVVTRLGVGGMGIVFLVRGRNGKLFAVKMLLNTHDAEAAEELRSRFRREMQVHASLPSSPYLVQVDTCQFGERPWMAIDFVDALSLQSFVAKRYPNGLPDDMLLTFFRGLVEALKQLHEHNIVHRDIKPSNILVPPTDGPKLIDLGIARKTDGTRITGTNVIVGTPAYMAPEHINHPQQLSLAGDVFSLGAVICFGATGEPPFVGSSDGIILMNVVTATPDLQRVPAFIRDIVAQCLHKEPANRPTAIELREALARIANA